MISDVAIDRMWRPIKSTRQMVLVGLLLTLVVSMMTFLHHGFSIKVVRTVPGDIATGMGFEPQKPVVVDKLTTPLPVTNSTTTKKTVYTTTAKMIEENPVPDPVTLSKMGATDLVNFYHSYVMSPRRTCSKVKRMGVVKDGGWEMCDDPLYRPDPSNCLVYSFGINYDFSYDDDIAEYGCEVHSFDPSMRNNDHLRGKRIHFHKTGIGGSDSVFFKDVVTPWQLHTLATHRTMLGHSVGQRRVDIVKMDVEGAELDSVITALRDGSLSDVRQFSIETHLSFAGPPSVDKYMRYLGLHRALFDAGFRIYLSSRNHVWSSFKSPHIGKQRVTCHEINMVNIRNTNNLTHS